MSDCCHCAEPNLVRSEGGGLCCRSCGLWYDEKIWREDHRVKREQTDIDAAVESILAVGEGRKP